MSEWQPIETAPKDETTIIAAQDDDVFVCVWLEDDADPINDEFSHRGWFDIVNCYRRAPSHWMPLPEPPK